MDLQVVLYDSLPDDSKAIREEVFVKEQGFQEEFDTVDNHAFHFVAYDGLGKPIGTCRIFSESSEQIYYLGRLAVLKQFRGLKVGSALISAAELTARSKGAESILLHSQHRAMRFYKKCGYEEFGEVDFEEGCPHIWMRKKLN